MSGLFTYADVIIFSLTPDCREYNAMINMILYHTNGRELNEEALVYIAQVIVRHFSEYMYGLQNEHLTNTNSSKT